jgi:hypothetical protein
LAALPGAGSKAATSSELTAVEFLSATRAWAVGSYRVYGQVQTLLASWDGQAWQWMTTPDPAFDQDQLNGVVTMSPDSAWAVGYNAYEFGRPRALALHWNGATWTKVRVPVPGGARSDSTLTAVAAAPGGTAWAVGSYSSRAGGAESRGLIEHYSDGHWTMAAIPRLAGAALSAVASASASRAWAAGSYGQSAQRPLLLQWNGRSWTQERLPELPGEPSAALSGLTAASPASAWAAGSYTKGGITRTLLLSWNGKTWRVLPSANPGGTRKNDLNFLAAVAGRSCADIWAVGYYSNPSAAQHSLSVRC